MDQYKEKLSGADKGFHIINGLFLVFCLLIVVYPLFNVISSSFSEPRYVIAGKVTFFPKGFNIEAYKQVFRSATLMTGFKNSIIYTATGTTVNIVMTILAAYPLSRRDFVGRTFISTLFVITMIFSAPLIPTYLNIRNLGMYDSMWAIIIPGAISTFNMIIARTYFQNSIPEEMIEASRIDGATDIGILIRLVIPLSKPIIAVLVLYYAVAHWNSFFNAFIYLSTDSKFPLQVVLRNILSTADALREMISTTVEEDRRLAMIEVMKYAVIVVGSLPVIALYPIVQKHFVKGIMIGSVKG